MKNTTVAFIIGIVIGFGAFLTYAILHQKDEYEKPKKYKDIVFYGFVADSSKPKKDSILSIFNDPEYGVQFDKSFDGNGNLRVYASVWFHGDIVFQSPTETVKPQNYSKYIDLKEREMDSLFIHNYYPTLKAIK